MEATDKRILQKLCEETKFSGVELYPVDISEIQQELNMDENTFQKAINSLLSQGLIEFKAIGGTMIQFTRKGKISFCK